MSDPESEQLAGINTEEKNITKSPTHQNKKFESDSEAEKIVKTQYDSASVISSSSDGTESENSRRMKKRYDIEYHQYSRSKSTSSLFKKHSEKFPTVREENEEFESVLEDKDKEKIRKLKFLIQHEGYDPIEESYSEKPRKFTKSTKALSLMDPVVEVKEDIDFNQLRVAPFKKLKCLMDFEEDSKIGVNPSSLHYNSNRYEIDEAIAEDNLENEVEVIAKKKKYYTHSLKKITEFVDLSDMIEEQNVPHNIIEEEIKEDPEHEEQPEEVLAFKCK